MHSIESKSSKHTRDKTRPNDDSSISKSLSKRAKIQHGRLCRVVEDSDSEDMSLAKPDGFRIEPVSELHGQNKDNKEKPEEDLADIDMAARFVYTLLLIIYIS